MNAYREGYRDGLSRADYSDQFFGDDWIEYEAGQEQAAIDLEEDGEAIEEWQNAEPDHELPEGWHEDELGPAAATRRWGA